MKGPLRNAAPHHFRAPRSESAKNKEGSTINTHWFDDERSWKLLDKSNKREVRLA